MSGKILMVVLALVLGSSSAFGQWPSWRGPVRDGTTTESIANTDWSENEPQVLWSESIGWGFSAVAVSDGRVFALGNVDNHDVLYCFDTGGELLWKQSHPEPRTPRQYEGGPNASPVVGGDMVFTLSKQGKVFARNVEDGSVVWSRDLKEQYGIEIPTWGLAGSALVVDDMVVFNVGTCGMAFDRASGELVWENGADTAGYATAVVFSRGPRQMLAMFIERELAIVSAEDGQVLSRFDWDTRWDVNAADPIVDGDKMFISSGYNKGCALLEVDEQGAVKQLWQNTEMRNQMNASVLWDGYVYGFDEFELRCIDFETGQVQWSKESLGKGTLIVADGKLLILSEDGRLVLANASPSGYEELGQKRILQGRCWTSPVLADGLVYARNAEGDLVCLDLR